MSIVEVLRKKLAQQQQDASATYFSIIARAARGAEKPGDPDAILKALAALGPAFDAARVELDISLCKQVLAAHELAGTEKDRRAALDKAATVLGEFTEREKRETARLQAEGRSLQSARELAHNDFTEAADARNRLTTWRRQAAAGGLRNSTGELVPDGGHLAGLLAALDIGLQA